MELHLEISFDLFNSHNLHITLSSISTETKQSHIAVAIDLSPSQIDAQRQEAYDFQE